MANLVNPKDNTDKKGFNPNVDNSEKKVSSSGFGKAIWYLLFILIIPMFIHISIRNKLLRIQTKVNELASGIDVQLKKRRDTLVKLLDSSKAYMKHEKTIFTDLAKLRAESISAGNRATVDGKMNSLFTRFFGVMENYPELKAVKVVQELMEQSSYIEREIAASRRLYNSEVQMFNLRLFTWPTNVPASGMGLSTLPYFQASETDKKDVKLDFE